MRFEARKYLDDILRAARLATEFAAGHSWAEYAADPLLRSAVERQLEVVGEAVSQLARLAPETVEELSNYRQIIAFRNLLIHGYAAVDDRIVWDVLTMRLGVLVEEAETLLRS